MIWWYFFHFSALLQKFYSQKDKLEETESLLLASKEECRQACINYKVTQEKYTELEKVSVFQRCINKLKWIVFDDDIS